MSRSPVEVEEREEGRYTLAWDELELCLCREKSPFGTISKEDSTLSFLVLLCW
jgi:hypothetical protein